MVLKFDPVERDSFYKRIMCTLMTDLCLLKHKLILQLHAVKCKHFVFYIVFQWRANISSTDSEGKTVLHDLVELKNYTN